MLKEKGVPFKILFLRKWLGEGEQVSFPSSSDWMQRSRSGHGHCPHDGMVPQ